MCWRSLSDLQVCAPIGQKLPWPTFHNVACYIIRGWFRIVKPDLPDTSFYPGTTRRMRRTPSSPDTGSARIAEQPPPPAQNQEIRTVPQEGSTRLRTCRPVLTEEPDDYPRKHQSTNPASNIIPTQEPVFASMESFAAMRKFHRTCVLKLSVERVRRTLSFATVGFAIWDEFGFRE